MIRIKTDLGECQKIFADWVNAEGSSSHIAVICHSCLTCQSYHLPLLQLHSRMVLAVTSGLPFWNLPPHLYPCCSFSAWSILSINLLGKSYSALSQDPNTTSWEGFSCVSWITGHSLFNSQHRQERQCSDYIYLWVACLVPQWTERSLRAGASCVCIFVTLAPDRVFSTWYVPLKYLPSEWVYFVVWIINMTLYNLYILLDFSCLPLSGVLFFASVTYA